MGRFGKTDIWPDPDEGVVVETCMVWGQVVENEKRWQDSRVVTGEQSELRLTPDCVRL